MPATYTLTTFYTFAPLTQIKSAEVNNNFSAIRGHIIPVDPNTATAGATLTYDLGYTGHFWRGVFNQYNIMYANTTGSVPATPDAGTVAFYFKSDGKAYKKTSDGVENEVGGGALVVTSTRAAPLTLTVLGFTMTAASGARQMFFITGDTTTGTNITANPQISVSPTTTSLVVGQELIIVGRDDSRPVIFEDGNGLRLNGQFNANADSILGLVWDGSVFNEMFRNN